MNRFFVLLVVAGLFCLSLPLQAWAADDMAYWPGIRNPHVLKAEESYGLLQKSYLKPEAANAQMPPILLTRKNLEKVSVAETQEMAFQRKEASVPLNQLEEEYSHRASEMLLLHGGLKKTVSKIADSTDSEKPFGRVNEDYILQPGDQLEIVRRGAVNDRLLVTISEDGTLTAADLAPMAAAGNSLSQLRVALTAEAQKRTGLEIYANVFALRQISALVLGHVEKPGQKRLPAYSSIWEAVEAAGSIRDTGSWRQVKLVRAGKTEIIDLYPFLLGQGGVEQSPQLQDGDKIIIPPLGKTFALAGNTMQKGIFEMAGGGMGVQEALRYAGATARRAGQRIIAYMPTKDGREEGYNLTVEGAAKTGMRVSDGTLLFFQQENL